MNSADKSLLQASVSVHEDALSESMAQAFEIRIDQGGLVPERPAECMSYAVLNSSSTIFNVLTSSLDAFIDFHRQV